MLIRPYGDTRDDGIIQFSFTLPMAYSVKAADVGKQFLEKLGFHTVGIAECKAIDPEYTLFVAYGRTDVGIDPDEVKGDYLEVEEMDYYAINALIKERLGRKLSVVGAADRERRPHRGHRRDHEHEGLRRELRARALPGDGRAEHGLADPLRAAAAHGAGA